MCATAKEKGKRPEWKGKLFYIWTWMSNATRRTGRKPAVIYLVQDKRGYHISLWEAGMYFYHFAETGEHVFFPSLKNIVGFIGEAYETGPFKQNAAGRFNMDPVKAMEVLRKYGS